MRIFRHCISLSFYIFIVDLWLFVGKTFGHGRLIDPPGRGTMWRMGFDTPPNYNDHQLFCGGFARQWEKNKGRCGECGDPWDLARPRPNESGGTYGTGLVSRVYKKGEVITVTVHLTANHLGWFEFRLCENNKTKQFVKQSCLNKNVLKLVDHPGTRYQVKEDGLGLFRIRLQLPKDVTCRYCVIQWHYTSGNNWGFCKNGLNKAGCGPQEIFRSCSDIAIFSKKDSDYQKFKNLTRVINYKKHLQFDTNTGHYNSDDEHTSSGEEKSKENSKEIVPVIQTLSQASEEEENDNSKEKRRKYSDKNQDKKNWPTQNLSERKNNKIDNESSRRARPNRPNSRSSLLSVKHSSLERLLKKYRNPNYFSEDSTKTNTKMSKYISSDTFRKTIDASSSERTESKTFVPLREIRMKNLSKLINKPKTVKENSKMYRHVLTTKRKDFSSKTTTSLPYNKLYKRLSLKTTEPKKDRKHDIIKIRERINPVKRNEEDGDKKLENGNTVEKLSEVVSMLLNLTATSPSSREANSLLDTLSRGLSSAIERRNGLDDNRSSETSEKYRPTGRRKLTEALLSSSEKTVAILPITPTQRVPNTSPLKISQKPPFILSYSELPAKLPGILASDAKVSLGSEPLPLTSHLIIQSSPDKLVTMSARNMTVLKDRNILQEVLNKLPQLHSLLQQNIDKGKTDKEVSEDEANVTTEEQESSEVSSVVKEGGIVHRLYYMIT